MKKVFLVDDDEIINHVHSQVIKRIDASVELMLFRSGMQFIQFVKSPTFKAFPDIIFLDIRMPEMNGFEVLEELTANFSNELVNTKIYVLSSTLDERDLSHAVSFPIVSKFMSKPLSFEIVSELLSK